MKLTCDDSIRTILFDPSNTKLEILDSKHIYSKRKKSNRKMELSILSGGIGT